MPTTQHGDVVYAEPDRMEEYVQTDPNQFSLANTDDTDDWRQFLERIQARMKQRIDEFCDRDFEDHPGETITLDGGANGKRILDLGVPTPVRDVTAVRVGGDVVPADEYVWNADGQLIRTELPTTTVVAALASDDDREVDRPEWEPGYGNIEVDLDYGYQTPPQDVVEAELKLVAHTVAGLAQLREGMVVEQDDFDIVVQLPTAMTAEIRGMLSEHRSRGRTMGVL